MISKPHSSPSSLLRLACLLLVASTGACGKYGDFLISQDLAWKSATRKVADPGTGKKFNDRYHRIIAKKPFGFGVVELPNPIQGAARVELTAGWFGGKTPKESQIGQVNLALEEREGAGIAALIALFFLDGATVEAVTDQGSVGNQFFPGVKSLDLAVEFDGAMTHYLARPEGGTSYTSVGTSGALDTNKVHVPTVGVGVIEKGVAIGLDDFNVPINTTDGSLLAPDLAAALCISKVESRVVAATIALDGVFEKASSQDDAKQEVLAALDLIGVAQTKTAALAGAKKAKKKLKGVEKRLLDALGIVNKKKLKGGDIDDALDKLDQACCDLVIASVDVFPLVP